MQPLSLPLLSAAGFVLGCAALRASRRYANDLTPLLTGTTILLIVILLLAVCARVQILPFETTGRDEAGIPFDDAL
ncbi:conserved hypothetical protein [Methylobacterium nodulans ORS 2060]|uniref:Uncharacterized protein n=1 Tax=Methylobacterium nodulans (strain LMG 21967 / CNCM I-2342 / ORS 2060) TaxID=460265 RepID=B8IHM8_METNO|nr:conserved hypothetical protein [Methylobacterium nodulans ORS 2060]